MNKGYKYLGAGRSSSPARFNTALAARRFQQAVHRSGRDPGPRWAQAAGGESADGGKGKQNILPSAVPGKSRGRAGGSLAWGDALKHSKRVAEGQLPSIRRKFFCWVSQAGFPVLVLPLVERLREEQAAAAVGFCREMGKGPAS